MAGDVVDGDGFLVVGGDEVAGPLYVLHAGAGLGGHGVAGLLDQERKKLVEFGGHIDELVGVVAAAAVDIHQQFLHALRLLQGDHWVLGGEARRIHENPGIVSVESHPTVFPGIICIGLVIDGHAGIDEKGLPFSHRMLLAVQRVHAPALHHKMDQIKIPYLQPAVKTPAALLMPGAVNGHGSHGAELIFKGIFVFVSFHKPTSPHCQY